MQQCNHVTNSPLYSIRKHLAFWSLTFEGRQCTFDHEQGAYYVAYLLLNPPSEPIHGMALELKAHGYFRHAPEQPCATYILDPATGQTLVLDWDTVVQERNLCLDDAEAAWAIRRKQRELETIVEDPYQIAAVKTEAECELEAIYEFQRKRPLAPLTA